MEALQRLAGIRSDILGVANFDELIDRRIIKSYRAFKHQLGELFFQPDVLIALIETNLALKNTIGRLYRREQHRLVSDYQQIFELQREVSSDGELGQELSDFQQEVRQFEERLQREIFSVEELARLREKVRSLMPRLGGTEAPPEVEEEPPPPPEARFAGEGYSALEEDEEEEPSGGPAEPQDELIRSYHQQLIEALESTDPGLSPRDVALSPATFSFRLEAREVIAYRRLTGGEECDREIEQFILDAAALRARIQEEVDEIRSIMDDTLLTRRAPVFTRSAGTTRLADLYQRRFMHLVERAVLKGQVEDAQQFQLLRMRMVRESSGLWLLVHR
jgi:hypothetical protein